MNQLKNLGFDRGSIDRFFGSNTMRAASDEVVANGSINGPSGAFEEVFPDEGACLHAVVPRLGVACP